MSIHVNQHSDHDRKSGVGRDGAQRKSRDRATFSFTDNRPEAKQLVRAKKLAEGGSIRNEASLRAASEMGTTPGKSDLPEALKSGIESLSGVSMDNVRIHYGSTKPAQVQAFAYTQGRDIHLGPGQEQHLPHEAWHVVQQSKGTVPPTLQANGVSINDNPALEHEADVMGAKARKIGTLQKSSRAALSVATTTGPELIPSSTAAQRQSDDANPDDDTIPPEVMEEIEELGGAIVQRKARGSAGQVVVQRAYTARRPLGGKLKAPGSLKSRWFKDKGIFHEHIFFEDGETPANIGFMGKNGLGSETSDAGYTKVRLGLGDDGMRDAVDANTPPGKYNILGNNCQRWVGNVLKTYYRSQTQSTTHEESETTPLLG